jgi:hypothetical protein
MGSGISEFCLTEPFMLNAGRNETFSRGSLYCESVIRGREHYIFLVPIRCSFNSLPILFSDHKQGLVNGRRICGSELKEAANGGALIQLFLKQIIVFRIYSRSSLIRGKNFQTSLK